MKTIVLDELIEYWLNKYHNITIKEVIEKYPEECKSGRWFRLFPVTQEQHDEWEIWAKEFIRKKYKISKRTIKQGFWSIYLDSAPSIKQKELSDE